MLDHAFGGINLHRFLRSSDPVETAAKKPQSIAPLKSLDAKTHIPSLDGIRGIAVILIVFCHATQRPMIHWSGPIDFGILSFARVCWTGVDLFFVLSGFLITGILFDAKGQDHYFRNFYARRTLRIFPLYYVCLFMFLILLPMLPAAFTAQFGHTPVSQGWYWSYLSNYSRGLTEQFGPPDTHILQVSWSLGIEEQFYLCWAPIVLLCNRKMLLRICFYMFFGSMAIRTILLANGYPNIALSFTPCRVDALAMGAAIALFARGPGGIAALIKPAKILAPVTAFLIPFMLIGMYAEGYHRGFGQSPAYVVLGTALFSILFGAVLILAVTAARGSISNRFFSHPVLLTYGKYSYAVYLLHMPILILLANYVFHPDSIVFAGSHLPGLLIFYVITFIASLIAGMISWNVLEKHFLKLKKFVPMEKKLTGKNLRSATSPWENVASRTGGGLLRGR